MAEAFSSGSDLKCRVRNTFIDGRAYAGMAAGSQCRKQHKGVCHFATVIDRPLVGCLPELRKLRCCHQVGFLGSLHRGFFKMPMGRTTLDRLGSNFENQGLREFRTLLRSKAQMTQSTFPRAQTSTSGLFLEIRQLHQRITKRCNKIAHIRFLY